MPSLWGKVFGGKESVRATSGKASTTTKILARFDIQKIGSTSYGKKCWKIIWGAVRLEELTGTHLFEGDSVDTLSGREHVYCIAFECPHPALAETIHARLSESKQFREVGAKPAFYRGRECDNQPLVPAGTVTERGLFNIDAWNPRNALAELRGVEQPSSIGNPNWPERLPFTDYGTQQEEEHKKPKGDFKGATESCTVRVQIESFGIYRARIVRTFAHSDYAAGHLNDLGDLSLMQRTDCIPLQKGLTFGVTVVASSQAKDRLVKLRRINRFPPPGLKNLKTGHMHLLEEFTQEFELGKPTHVLYTFDEDYEMLPGKWKFEFWDGENVLAEQTLLMSAAKGPRELERVYLRYEIGDNYPYSTEVYKDFKISRMFVRYYEGECAGPNDVMRDEYVVWRGTLIGQPDSEFEKYGLKYRFLTIEQARSFIDGECSK